MMTRTSGLAAIFVLSTSLPVVADVVVLETDNLRLNIHQDGSVRSLVSKPEGREYIQGGERLPIAVVYRGGHSVPASPEKRAAFTGRWVYRGGRSTAASRVTRDGDKLRVEFGDAGTAVTFRVIARPQYLAFELLQLTGAPIDRIEFLQLKLTDLPQRGAWVNFAFNEQFGVCLCAGNVRTHVEMDQETDCVTMRAVAENEVGFPGTVAVLFGCREPWTRFLDVMAVVERDFGMPNGAESRRQPSLRYSYLWISPTPQNIGDYIRIAKRAGIRMILFSYTTFSKGAGHFLWKDTYPNGMADLKHVTDSIRDAGLKVGLHIHYNKTRKTDPYVTPVPDARLHHVRRFTLADAVDKQVQTIPVAEDPTGCTLDKDRRILKIGNELIAYEDYRTDPGFAFIGCERGHLGTSASTHGKGTALDLLDVDTWPIFVRLDQNSDIQDEVARRIGDICRATGPYEMVYFDGAEDVHAPYWHHVASAQQRVFRHLSPTPPVCEAAHYTHFSWHMITRSNAYDIVAPADGMKDFCRLMPCPTAAQRTRDFSRIDFGWLGRLDGKPGAAAGPDVWEYVASRAAAWDCPISVKLSRPEITSNPRWEDCLDTLRIWEDARLENHLTEAQRKSLQNVRPEDAHYVPCFQQRPIWEKVRTNGELTATQRRILANRQEHHLFRNEHGEYELVPITEVPTANASVKAYCFKRKSCPDDTYVLLWSVDKDVALRVPASEHTIRWMRPFGTELSVERSGNETTVTVGSRSYLQFVNSSVDEVRRAISP